jgi:hypothetical protein
LKLQCIYIYLVNEKLVPGEYTLNQQDNSRAEIFLGFKKWEGVGLYEIFKYSNGACNWILDGSGYTKLVLVLAFSEAKQLQIHV